MTRRPLTADTITDDQIRSLAKGALAAGNSSMAEICDVALGVADSNADGSDPSEDDIEEARQFCADAINAADLALAEGK